jgi:hypothetical protein
MRRGLRVQVRDSHSHVPAPRLERRNDCGCHGSLQARQVRRERGRAVARQGRLLSLSLSLSLSPLSVSVSLYRELPLAKVDFTTHITRLYHPRYYLRSYLISILCYGSLQARQVRRERGRAVALAEVRILRVCYVCVSSYCYLFLISSLLYELWRSRRYAFYVYSMYVCPRTAIYASLPPYYTRVIGQGRRVSEDELSLKAAYTSSLWPLTLVA